MKAPWWSWLSPVSAWLVLILGAFAGTGPVLAAVAAVVLMATVFAAVYHAEVVAHRVGEPFGTLVLAVAVTVIEVALIVSVMISSPETKAGLARDTVFSAVMIVCNGIVGACLLTGGVRHHIQGFQLLGATSALAVLAPLTILTLVVPTVTTSGPGVSFSQTQLVFAGVVSLVLYGSFVFVQTVRHRDFFLPDKAAETDADSHAAPPPNTVAITSMAWLIVALVGVVGLAKLLTPAVESGLTAIRAPAAVVGIVIATLVLLPEGLAALRAAHANRLQTSLNLALGSALASIGLTIPTVAAVSIAFGMPLELGLGIKDVILLALTLFLGGITLGTGKTTVLQGVVHLVLFASFLFFAMVP